MQNPFIVSGNIPDEYFCDRQIETDTLIRLLTNGNNVVLISPRRMGKSGLIHHCYKKAELKTGYNTVFFDILQTASLQEFTFLFGKSIFESLMPGNKKLATIFIQALKSLAGKFSFNPTTGVPSFSIQLGDISQPQFTLEEIFNFLDSTSLPNIIAIDEFQQIANYPEKNVEAILRSHIQRCKCSNFIFAGSQQHLMTEMFLSQNRPFYQSTSFMMLEAIPKQVYCDFAFRLFEIHDKNIHKEDIMNLYDRFGGCTFYMQRVLNEAFSRTERDQKCSKAELDHALDAILESNTGLYMELLSTIPTRQKELLISIAKEEPVSGITSSDFINRNGLQSASSVQAATKKLIERNLISKSMATYSLTDKFLAVWLSRNY